ncbi:MAG: hypothetical protein ACR2L2_01100 [Acidobacteriota bacterium]
MFLGIARYCQYGHWIGADGENLGGPSRPGGWPSSWSLEELERDLDFYSRFQPNGLTHLRWWLFCAGDGLIDAQTRGLRTTLGDATQEHLAVFLEQVRKRGFQLLPVLLAFPSDWKRCGISSVWKTSQHPAATDQMSRWLTEPCEREQLCDLMGQAARLLAAFRDSIYAVELYNEPEGQIDAPLRMGGNGGSSWGVGGDQMMDFLTLLAARIDEQWRAAAGQAPRLTVGSGWNDSLNCNRSLPAAAPAVERLRRLQRDLISWHYYGKRLTLRSRPSARLLAPAAEISAGENLEVILGEVGARGFEDRSEGRGRFLRSVREMAEQRGYAGMFVWQDPCGFPVDAEMLVQVTSE